MKSQYRLNSLLIGPENNWKEYTKPPLIPVINATGVILHTNLGRAPLSQDAINAMQTVGTSYSTLEFDLPRGKRGSRSMHVEQILCHLTGAEFAFIVNNNASAVLLVLSGLASHKRVIISRTQLIEIGGGFRIPDVLKRSGAKLVEIGATNQVPYLRLFRSSYGTNQPRNACSPFEFQDSRFRKRTRDKRNL